MRAHIKELVSFSICLLPVMKARIEMLLWMFYITRTLDFQSVNVVVLICAELKQNSN